MLNHIVLMGRLTRDPELRRTGTGDCCSQLYPGRGSGLCAQGRGQRETDFIDIVAWRSTAEFVSKYFSRAAWLWFPAACRSAPGRTRTATNAAALGGGRQCLLWRQQAGHGVQRRLQRRQQLQCRQQLWFRNSYGSGGYSAPPPPSYAAPASAPASDFAMLEDDDAQLPF